MLCRKELRIDTLQRRHLTRSMLDDLDRLEIGSCSTRSEGQAVGQLQSSVVAATTNLFRILQFAKFTSLGFIRCGKRGLPLRSRRLVLLPPALHRKAGPAHLRQCTARSSARKPCLRSARLRPTPTSAPPWPSAPPALVARELLVRTFRWSR